MEIEAVFHKVEGCENTNGFIYWYFLKRQEFFLKSFKGKMLTITERINILSLR